MAPAICVSEVLEDTDARREQHKHDEHVGDHEP